MNSHHAPQPRRLFLGQFAGGFAGLALAAMLHRDGWSREAATPSDGRPHFAPRAKQVIWLFMNGGMSHVESFDPKPTLTRYGGKTIAETPFADAQDPKKLAIERLVVPDGNGNQRNTLYPLQVLANTGKAALRSAIGSRQPPGMSIDWRSSGRCGRPTAITERRRSSIPGGTRTTATFPIWAPGYITDWGR